jgi:Pup amidohydrolase
MGTETEYGIAVPGQTSANHMLASSQIVNAYLTATTTATRDRRPRWDFEEESPLRDARGFDVATGVQINAAGRDATDTLADDEIGLANVILTNGARLYVDHAHPEYSTP